MAIDEGRAENTNDVRADGNGVQTCDVRESGAQTQGLRLQATPPGLKLLGV